MNEPQDREVYNEYPVWKPGPAQASPAPKGGLSPRAKAGSAAAFVVLAASGMFAWSQYETAQASADVQKAEIALEQQKLNLQMEEQQAQQVKASGQETPAQKARREALQQCIKAAGSSYNGVQDCANAYPVIDPAGTLNDSQATASTSPTNSSSSPVGLVVLGGTAAVVAVGWAKKKIARP